ncbi:MAG: phosphatase PAP2 family protein [Thermoanaerobaculales bacterium]
MTDDRRSNERRERRRELIALLVLGVVATALFAATSLDIAAARIFYRPAALNHWPLAKQLPWSVLYGAARWIASSLVLASFAGIVVGYARERPAWRRYSVFVLLCVVVGPGIMINGIFKDHWDRPRPREIVEFGGPLHYVPAPLRGEGGGSFPCGHCSVGFLYGVGWWIWRRRRPPRAGASLAGGLIAGSALGLGRMAAGGHFLSDVVWSALLPFGVAHVLYYYVLRIPAHEAQEDGATGAAPPRVGLQRAMMLLAALGGTAVLLALFVTPHGTQLATEIPLSTLPSAPRIVEVAADTADVEIVLVDSPATQVSVAGELHGFGLPTSRMETHVAFDAEPVPTLRYHIEQRGWFTDLSGSLMIRLPAGRLERLIVRIARGNIKVTDLTGAGIVRSGTLQLDLRTKSGRVQTASVHSP